VEVDREVVDPRWDLDRVEILEWRADDPAFSQDRALEASGMAMHRGRLVVSVETYGRLLLIEPEPPHEARVVRLGVPVYSELEGVTFSGDTAFICDEAHAAVYAVELSGGPTSGPFPTVQLSIRGVGVRGGKIGFEGVASGEDPSILYVLLERSGDHESGCVSKIFTMRIAEDGLTPEGDPLIIDLEDCNWRLTGLEMWQGRLLALKTQFPGDRYEVIAVDIATGEWHVVLEMTDLLRSVRADGWGNNVEGIAVDEDGTLYLVGDNAVTGRVETAEPPPTDEKTLFLRIPPR
jgi:hypothetical protein